MILCLRTRSWRHTLFLVFSSHKIFFKKNIKACGRSPVNGWSYPINIWKPANMVCPQFEYRSPFPEDFFKYQRICTTASQWVVLDYKRNRLTTLTANIISDLVIVSGSAYPLTFDTCQNHLRSPWSGSSLTLGASAALHPHILVSDSISSKYFPRKSNSLPNPKRK